MKEKRYRISLWNAGCDTPVAAYVNVKSYYTDVTNILHFTRQDNSEFITSLPFSIEDMANA